MCRLLHLRSWGQSCSNFGVSGLFTYCMEFPTLAMEALVVSGKKINLIPITPCTPTFHKTCTEINPYHSSPQRPRHTQKTKATKTPLKPLPQATPTLLIALPSNTKRVPITRQAHVQARPLHNHTRQPLLSVTVNPQRIRPNTHKVAILVVGIRNVEAFGQSDER